MASLQTPPLWAALADAESILIAGAGGGFDIYAGLPLAIALLDAGRRVHLANLAFTYLELLDLDAWLARNVARIQPDTAGPDDYFPERTLARWLATRDLPATVYAFPRTGVQPLRAAYQALVEHLHVDAIVLIDGGTDILCRGDESSLATPEEDRTSLAAVAGLDVPVKLVSCLGFGIDAHSGLAHTQILENLAALARDGAYLGALSIPSTSREATLYRDAVADAHAATPSPTRTPPRRCGPASSTARSPPRWPANAATSSSPAAPRPAPCSSTRSWRCTSPLTSTPSPAP